MLCRMTKRIHISWIGSEKQLCPHSYLTEGIFIFIRPHSYLTKGIFIFISPQSCLTEGVFISICPQSCLTEGIFIFTYPQSCLTEAIFALIWQSATIPRDMSKPISANGTLQVRKEDSLQQLPISIACLMIRKHAAPMLLA